MMTMSGKSWRRAVLAAAALMATAAAHAVTYYWDINGTTPGASGGTTADGTWDGSAANWNSDATGGGAGALTATVGSADALYLSAGSNATGTSMIAVVGTQTFGGTVKPVLKDGSAILTGGALKITSGAEVTSGGTMTIDSQIDTSGATGSLGVGYGKVVYSNANNTSTMNVGTWIYAGGKLSTSVPGALGNGSPMLSWGGVPDTDIVAVIEQNTTLEFTGTTPINLTRSVGIYNGGAGVQTIDVQNLAGVTIAGNIGAVYGGVFDKKGPGRLTLTGAVYGLQATEVVTGALQVDGTMYGSSWGVFVKPGGILQGNGTINDYVELDGGVLAPGASIGTLTVQNDVTFNANSFFDVQFTGASADELVVSGNLDVGLATLRLFDLGTTFASPTGNDYLIAQFGTLGSYPFFQVQAPNYMTWTLDYGVQNVGFITLHLVPEPTSLALLVAALAVAGGRRRRQT